MYTGLSSEQPFHSKPLSQLRRGQRIATDLHLEDESFSQTAMGWTHGLCIQLASIENSFQRSAVSFQPGAARLELMAES